MSEPLNFVADQEPWCIYRLEDGTIIRARLVLVRMTRRDGQFTPEGFPVFDLAWQQIVDVTPSDFEKAEAEQRVKRQKESS